MNIQKYLIFCLISITLTLQNTFLIAWPVKVLTEQEMRNFSILDSDVSHTGCDASIQKVTNGTTIYILKQINDPSIDEQFLLINDVVASTIANDVGVHINEVFFIPYNIANHLKIFHDRPATLHSYVHGKDLEQELPNYSSKDFTIHQQIFDPLSIWQQQWPISKYQQGLNQNVIKTMSIHKDLQAIVAFDTFVGNADRSLPNIFYDNKNDRFYGIDQAAAFNTNLALFAYDRLKELLRDGYFLTCDVEVIYGLREYRNVLLQLKEDFKPLMIIQNMQELLPYLGSNLLQNDEAYLRMSYETKIIQQTNFSILELITMLNLIINSY